MNKTLEYYMGLPYTIELWRAAEGGWVIKVKELPGCVSQGKTREEAAANIREAIQGYIAALQEDGLPVPEEHFDTLVLAV